MINQTLTIAILGSGYVGLTTGACFAEVGYRVTCVDIEEEKIKALKEGIVSIHEPGLGDLVRSNMAKERLSFTADISKTIKDNFIVIICVGTPPAHDGSANMEYVYRAAREIGAQMESPKVIIQKSTAFPGTAREVKKIIAEELEKRGAKIDFEVVSNPEFLKEGGAINDFMVPDRVVVGVETERAKKIMDRLYGPFMRTQKRIVFMDPTSAELTKYAANTMLALRISFMNMMSEIAERVGADVEKIRMGIGSDPRIGPKYIFSGVGYGGSCFPKDIRALINFAERNFCDADLLKEVEKINLFQRQRFLNKITSFFKDGLEGKTFAVWGLAFKPKTDDIREAPSLYIVGELLKRGARVNLYDPQAAEKFKNYFPPSPNVMYAAEEYEALNGADALLLLTEWLNLRAPNFEKVKTFLRRPVIFDGRNIYDPQRLKEMGFDYFSLGR